MEYFIQFDNFIHLSITKTTAYQDISEENAMSSTNVCAEYGYNQFIVRLIASFHVNNSLRVTLKILGLGFCVMKH